MPLRASMNRLVAITHDVEIIRTEKAVLAEIDIDLDAVVPARQIDLGLGNTFKVEQDGRAQLHYSHSECVVVDDGQLGIDVPLKITDLNLTYGARVNVTVGIQNHPIPGSGLVRFVARYPEFCPPGELAPEMQKLVLDEIQDVIENLGGVVRLPRLPEMQLGQFYQYAASMGQPMRVHGEVKRRPRRVIPPMTALPGWADSGIKILTSVITDQLLGEIRRHGVGLVSGPSYVGNNSFNTVVRGSREKTVKVGCTKFGAEATVTVSLRTQMRISPPNTLVIDTWMTHKDIDIDIHPRALGWLFDELLGWAENWVARKIPNIESRKEIGLFSARRATVEVDDQTIRLAMQTRRLFME